jgi:hypothetical protein
MKTQKQIKGTRFEIWLEKLLKECGCQNVHRNVYIYRAPLRYRQADLTYDFVKQGKIYRAVVEAKYLKNGIVSDRLRSNVVKKQGKRSIEIASLIYEVRERRHFAKAGLALLVTNQVFDSAVEQEAKKHRIKLIDGKRLQALYSLKGHRESIDDAIKSIDINRYSQRRYVMRLY